MKKYLFIIILALLSLGGLFFYQSAKLNDGKLHVVFCDVGQGDAIFIRTPEGSDILIDAGPNEKVVSCLEQHMPFWDRTLELVFLTHPHADHMNGLMSVFTKYQIGEFVTEQLSNNSGVYKRMQEELTQKHISQRIIYSGDKFLASNGVIIRVLGPSKKYLQKTSPGGKIGESGEFASLVLLISYENFDILFTGDSQVSGIEDALDLQNISDLEVLQVPHHGSKTGLNGSLIEKLNPKVAVISVGAKNKYGHPRPEVIEILRNREIKILGTDQYGEVEIVSDGKGFAIR